MFYDTLIAFLPEICAWVTGGFLGSALMYIYMDVKLVEARRHLSTLDRMYNELKTGYLRVQKNQQN